MLPVSRIVGSNPMNLGYVYACNNFVPNTIFGQIYRWKRKPMRLGTAKSKIFRVPQKPYIPPEDFIEMRRLHNNFKTYFASVKKYCIQVVENNRIELDHDYIQKQEDKDFEQSMGLNDLWNKEVAKIREIRLEKEEAETMENIIKTMHEKDEELKMKLQIAESNIMKAKAERPTFITEAEIDQAIEKALQNVDTYDKVLDVEGNFYEVKPSKNKSTAQSST